MQTLVADDHGLVRDGLKVVLDKISPDVTVIECADYSEALERAAQCSAIDLAILDLQMPGMNGVAGVEGFRSRFPDTPLIIISGSYRLQDVWDALRAGAVGFIPKYLGKDGTLNALRLVLGGEKFIPSDVLSGGEFDANQPCSAISPNIGPLDCQLTERERQALNELTKGIPNKVIAANLGIEEVTVKLHLRNVYRKLGATSRTHAVKIALDRGWTN